MWKFYYFFDRYFKDTKINSIFCVENHIKNKKIVFEKNLGVKIRLLFFCISTWIYFFCLEHAKSSNPFPNCAQLKHYYYSLSKDIFRLPPDRTVYPVLGTAWHPPTRCCPGGEVIIFPSHQIRSATRLLAFASRVSIFPARPAKSYSHVSLSLAGFQRKLHPIYCLLWGSLSLLKIENGCDKKKIFHDVYFKF